MRNTVGLEVKDAVDLFTPAVSRRAFQYWEDGTYKIPIEVLNRFDVLCELLSAISKDVQADIWAAALPHNMISLPYFVDFEKFKLVTGSDCVVHWSMWHKILEQLMLKKMISTVDDEMPIPKEFRIWKFFASPIKPTAYNRPF